MDVLRMTTQSVSEHGLLCKYKKVGAQAYDPSTGSVTSTDSEYSVKMYPRHLNATQWSYPDLIGKDAIMFYLAGGQSFTPEVKDSIEYDLKTYKIQTIQRHMANGVICLYRIVAVKA